MGNRHISTITYEPNGSSRGDRINVITKGKDDKKVDLTQFFEIPNNFLFFEAVPHICHIT